MNTLVWILQWARQYGCYSEYGSVDVTENTLVWMLSEHGSMDVTVNTVVWMLQWIR
jgi:hypothetical protein